MVFEGCKQRFCSFYLKFKFFVSNLTDTYDDINVFQFFRSRAGSSISLRYSMHVLSFNHVPASKSLIELYTLTNLVQVK